MRNREAEDESQKARLWDPNHKHIWKEEGQERNSARRGRLSWWGPLGGYPFQQRKFCGDHKGRFKESFATEEQGVKNFGQKAEARGENFRLSWMCLGIWWFCDSVPCSCAFFIALKTVIVTIVFLFLELSIYQGRLKFPVFWTLSFSVFFFFHWINEEVNAQNIRKWYKTRTCQLHLEKYIGWYEIIKLEK